MSLGMQKTKKREWEKRFEEVRDEQDDIGKEERDLFLERLFLSFSEVTV